MVEARLVTTACRELTNAAKGVTFLYAINDPTVPSYPKSSSGLALNQDIYDVDLFDTSASTIAKYKAAGKRVICYISAGSTENWRPDFSQFDKACYAGHPLDGWEGENWIDTHSASCKTSVRKIMLARIQLAASKGCDGVDPDNIDASTQDPAPWGITSSDAEDYLNFLASSAHANGLACGLKNGGDYLSGARGQRIVSMFDFSVIEQCSQYDECATYKPFLEAGKPAFDIEYKKSISPCPLAGSGLYALKYKTTALSYKNVQAVCKS